VIDIKQIRENPERFKKAAKDKRVVVDIDRLLYLDSQILLVKKELQVIRTDKNRIGNAVSKLSGDEKQSALSQLLRLKQREVDLLCRLRNIK